MARSPSRLIFVLAAGLAAFFSLLDVASAQDGDKVWQYREAKGTAGVGRESAGLIFGVPETDNVQVQAGCESGFTRGGKTISLVLAADIGTLKDGNKINVKFTGGRFKHDLDGIVHGTQIEEGVTGAHVQLSSEDRLWQAMQNRDVLEYQVAGYQVATLKLRGGASTIQRFVMSCARYAQKANQGSRTSTRKSATAPTRVAGNSRQRNDGIDEKEAFESAKELNTIEGWEAFLNAFPTGFRADLARAYVKRLGGSASGPEQTTSRPSRGDRRASPGKKMPLLDTFESRPGTAPWRTTRYEIDDGNARVRAAAVKGNGVELLFYCDGKRLSGILREYDRGLYPNFDRRIAQGLAGERQGRSEGDPVPIPFEFSNGRTYRVGAQVMEMNGEVALSRRGDGRAFKADGSLISDMMSEDTVTISAPPFIANLQLKKSRPALCSLIRSCGARAEGCGSTTKTYQPKKKIYKKKKKKKRACRKSGGSCKRHSDCCGGKCCLTDFEECEGFYGRCDG